MKTIKTSPKIIDIVCPCIKEHIPRLSVCSESWKKHILNPISQIFIIGPKDIEKDVTDMGFEYIEENKYLDITDKNLKSVRKDRRGWLKQQLIKLNGNPGECQNYLCIDSDVFLIRQTPFINNFGHPIFYMNNTYWKLAIETAEKLLDKPHKEELSYVTDKMIFNVNVIQELKNNLEKINGKNWKQTIIESYDNQSIISFSEFELYGLFYQGENEKQIKHYKRCKWNDEYTYEILMKKFLPFDQITFE